MKNNIPNKLSIFLNFKTFSSMENNLKIRHNLEALMYRHHISTQQL